MITAVKAASNHRLAGAAADAAVAFPTQLTHKELIAEAGRSVRMLRVRKNAELLLAGQHYASVYVNHDGWLLRYKILHNGSRQIVDFVLPGQMFGIQACLFNTALYSVATITDSALSEIPFDVVASIFERSPKLAKALFWWAASESAILGEHLVGAARRSAYERVAHLLLELFVRLKRTGQTSGLSFHMPLTQELIGDAVGLTTVHVNRTIRALREDKLVAVERYHVSILDFERLSMIADFENSYLGAAAQAIGQQINSWKAETATQPKPILHPAAPVLHKSS
jgi:CRP-like cAMP-binding protein